MSRPERLLLAGLLAGLLLLLLGAEPVAGALGAVAGAGLGVAVAGRLRRLRTRMDQRLGPDDAPPPTGFRLRRPLLRLALLGAVLVAVGTTTLLLPFVGDEVAAALSTGVTALPLVLTLAGLRR